jgi:hypothetical protein
MTPGEREAFQRLADEQVPIQYQLLDSRFAGPREGWRSTNFALTFGPKARVSFSRQALGAVRPQETLTHEAGHIADARESALYLPDLLGLPLAAGGFLRKAAFLEDPMLILSKEFGANLRSSHGNESEAWERTKKNYASDFTASESQLGRSLTPNELSAQSERALVNYVHALEWARKRAPEDFSRQIDERLALYPALASHYERLKAVPPTLDSPGLATMGARIALGHGHVVAP